MLFTVNCISITEDSVETISFVASIGYDPLPLSAGIWSSITVLVSVPYDKKRVPDESRHTLFLVLKRAAVL